MSEPRDLPALSREELLALVVELQRQITELRAEIDQLTRGGKRQAAPFSKGSRVENPKPPGRKPGSGPFHYRAVPPREAITMPPVDVKVTLDGCPACGGLLEEERVDCAYQTDIPEERTRNELSVHEMSSESKWCETPGFWVQGTLRPW